MSAVVSDVETVSTIVANEDRACGVTRCTTSVAPIVVALRSRAHAVVEAELRRLAKRLSDLDNTARAEVASTVHRVVDKLLHGPITKVADPARQSVETSYTEALRQLFALDSADESQVASDDGNGGDQVCRLTQAKSPCW